jgi:hypothetical protein
MNTEQEDATALEKRGAVAANETGPRVVARDPGVVWSASVSCRSPSPSWDVAQNAFGEQGVEFLEVFGRVLLRAAQDPMRILHEISAESPGRPLKTRSRQWQDFLRAMQVELRQLDRRYEGLRTRCAGRERTLLASLAEIGQQAPLIVARDAATLVVVDGYKRVRALDRLGHDVAEALEWALTEPEALLLDRYARVRPPARSSRDGSFASCRSASA